MSLGNTAETDLLKLIFQNIAWANIGNVAGLQPSGVAGNFYISLHTSDPGEAGDQESSECDYTSYARVAVVRSAAGWTVVGNNVSNTAATTFPKCTGGNNTATHFVVGTDISGAGHLIGSSALDSSLAILNNITPNYAIGELDIDIE